MTLETKEEVLQRVLSQEKPRCPHCGAEMILWEVPQISFEEGSGWGVPYLFVCFNDRCPMYMHGWDHVKENYGHHASYRCICYPGTDQFECMAVFGPMGGIGQIIDEQRIAKQQTSKAAIRRELLILADCHKAKDWRLVLKILLDTNKLKRVRIKAAEIIGEIGELAAIEPLRNHPFGNSVISRKVEESVGQIHQRHFTRECPFCAEIIKKRAKICKHCGKVLPSH